MDKLRIAVVAPVLYPWQMHLKKALSEKNNEVTLFSCGIYGNNLSWMEFEKYIEKIPRIEFLNTMFPHPRLIFMLLRKRYHFAVMLATESFLTMVSCIAAKVAGSQLMLIVEENCERTHASVGTRLLAGIKRFFVKWIHSNQRIIIAESQASKDYLLRLGCREERIAVIPHGIDINLFRPLPPDEDYKKRMGIASVHGGSVITYLGGFNYLKGIDFVVKAITDPRLKDCQFLIPCFGSYNSDKYVTILKGQENCCLLHQIEYEEMIRLYSLTDIVICPSLSSRTEGCERSPNVLIEAMACGKAVVASNVGGIPTYVKDAGILISESDVESLVRSILKLSANDDLLNELKIKARRHAEEVFNIEKYSDNLIAQYSLIK